MKDFYLSYNACILQLLYNWLKKEVNVYVYVLETMAMDIQGVFYLIYVQF